MAKTSKPESSFTEEPKPSQFTDAYWLYAERTMGEYPRSYRAGRKIAVIRAGEANRRRLGQDQGRQ